MSIEVLSVLLSVLKGLVLKVFIEHTHVQNIEDRLSICFNRVFCVFSLSLSLSLSLPCMLREPKLSIEPAFLFLYSVSNTCFRTLFSTWYQSARVENLCSRHNLKKKPTEKNRKNGWIEA